MVTYPLLISVQTDGHSSWKPELVLEFDHGYYYMELITENTHTTIIRITDDQGSKVITGFSDSLKNLISTFYRSPVEVV